MTTILAADPAPAPSNTLLLAGYRDSEPAECLGSPALLLVFDELEASLKRHNHDLADASIPAYVQKMVANGLGISEYQLGWGVRMLRKIRPLQALQKRASESAQRAASAPTPPAAPARKPAPQRLEPQPAVASVPPVPAPPVPEPETGAAAPATAPVKPLSASARRLQEELTRQEVDPSEALNSAQKARLAAALGWASGTVQTTLSDLRGALGIPTPSSSRAGIPHGSCDPESGLSPALQQLADAVEALGIDLRQPVSSADYQLLSSRIDKPVRTLSPLVSGLRRRRGIGSVPTATGAEPKKSSPDREDNTTLTAKQQPEPVSEPGQPPLSPPAAPEPAVAPSPVPPLPVRSPAQADRAVPVTSTAPVPLPDLRLVLGVELLEASRLVANPERRLDALMRAADLVEAAAP